MINLDNVCKKYNTSVGEISALEDINLHVSPGEIYGIIGKSGAGKSTLIRCANLLERPTRGRVVVAGQELTELSSQELRRARQQIGMIFQHFNLLSSRTIYGNIALPLELSGYSKKNIHLAVMPLLELIGLNHKKDDYPSQLSGGQKQRVAIARALASKPQVLLSDEATSALDPETTSSILDLLKNIRDTHNLTILLITHEMSVIKACCDRVGILHQGHLIEQNEVSEFFSRPKTDIAKNFIAFSNSQLLPDRISKCVVANEQQNTHPVWHLSFWEKAATQPIISQLINQFQLRINILQANMEYINQNAMGIMIIAIKGEKNKMQEATAYLQTIGVRIEVLGHVPNDIISFS